MRKGRVKITPGLIEEALKFPDDWKIESITSHYKFGYLTIEAVISGDDFPEEPTQEGEPIKECLIIIQKQPEFIFKVETL